MTYNTLVENKHGVPIKQWNEWNARAQAMFNMAHGSTMESCKSDEVETISWEAAVRAAYILHQLDKSQSECLTSEDVVL